MEQKIFDCSSLTSITILDSTTSIERSAFSGFSCLTNITIPDSVTSIGGDAFYGCSSLASITIPNGVTNIGYRTFSGCSSLASITIPNGVTNIGYRTFSGCSSLTSITIPDSVTSIEEEAFSGCSSLTSITIPDSVTSIGEYAFSGCSSLAGITIPDSMTTIGEYAFSGCSGPTSITIPDSVKSIRKYAFWGCSNLASIAIPESVNSIGNYAFYECDSLKSITIPDSVISIGGYAFCKCSNLMSITIPDGVTSINAHVFGGCTGLTNITIPDSVTIIEECAFTGCTSLTSIVIPDSVTIIPREAFRGCRNLISITIPESVTTISPLAFYKCLSLTSITIPDSVTTIEENAFYGCSSLKYFTIGDGVMNVDNIIGGCTNLRIITVPANMKCAAFELPGVFEDSEHNQYETFPVGLSEGLVLKRSIISANFYDAESESYLEELNTKIYSGEPLIQNLKVEVGTMYLEQDTDYSLSYINNVEVGEATVIITGIGDFSGEIRKTFTINPKPLKDAEITGLSDKTYTGNAFEPKPVVTLDGKTLVLDQDYYLAYKYNINASENYEKRATVAVKGMGNYKDVAVARFWIKPASLSSAVITEITDKTYTGEAFKPKPVVKLNGKTLVLNQDYYLAYKYNLNVSESEAKRATVAVKGMGNYKDVAVTRFWIKPASLSSAVITGISDKVYTGTAFKPKPVVKLNGKTLLLNRDYYLAYKYNINVSESEAKRATIAVKGMGNYKDVAVARFWIKPASLSSAELLWWQDDKTYGDGIPNKTYTGKAIEPKPIVKFNGKTLKLGTDYTLAYKYNINATHYEKKATVAVKGIGNYKGAAVERFEIDPASLKNADITGIVTKDYTGQKITQAPVVKVGGRTLKLNTDYELSYLYNDRPGEARIYIEGIGNYYSYTFRDFGINPKPVQIRSLSSPKTKQIKITWEEMGVWGYQIEICTNKDFSKPEIKKTEYSRADVFGANAFEWTYSKDKTHFYMTYTITAAKANTTYYVRIRAIERSHVEYTGDRSWTDSSRWLGKKNYYSPWSAVKTIKTK